MRVMLISANTETINMPAMPLGLAGVATAVRNAGHEVRFLDLMYESSVLSRLSEELYDFKPEIIGVSVRNIDDQVMDAPDFLLEKVRDVVRLCRKQTSAPVILGGAGYSMFPDRILEYLDADMGIAGEGEVALPLLLEQLYHPDPSKLDVPGLHIRGETTIGSPRSFLNLDRASLPDHTLLTDPASGCEKGSAWVPVQTRRGCSLRCSYCSTPAIEGTVLRKRSVGHVADWLEHWVKAGYHHFFFVDNTFNLPPSYAKNLCRTIIDRHLDINWWCIVYPKNVDDELAGLMKRAGCKQVSIGFESGSDTILEEMNKRFTKTDIRQVCDVFRQVGIDRMGFLMLGGPGESRETVEESLAFVETLMLEGLKVTRGIRIYPETPLEKRAMSEGVISGETDLLYPRFYCVPYLSTWLRDRIERWSKGKSWVRC